MKKNRYATLAKIAVIPVLAAILFIPIKVPYRITVTGQIRPLRAWMLTRVKAGSSKPDPLTMKKGPPKVFP